MLEQLLSLWVVQTLGSNEDWASTLHRRPLHQKAQNGKSENTRKQTVLHDAKA